MRKRKVSQLIIVCKRPSKAQWFYCLQDGSNKRETKRWAKSVRGLQQGNGVLVALLRHVVGYKSKT